MALKTKILASWLLTTTAIAAYANIHGIKPSINGVSVLINNVPQNVLYLAPNSTIGTSLGIISVKESGGIFDGKLTLSGADASKFKISGSSLQTAMAIAPGTYQINVIATTNSVTGSPFTQSKTVYMGQQYFISPSGNDTHNGLSPATAWLTPNHSISCGDTVTAVSGTYSASNFQGGDWGTVSCSGNDNVAWLKCQQFDTCFISGTNSPGQMFINTNYWGVQGWELKSNSFGSCISVVPATSTVDLHHLAFGNNVFNNCSQNGLSTEEFGGGFGPSSDDYMVIAGNLAYDSAGASDECYSGISLGALANVDTAPGTHIYVAYNISWANFDGANCGGGNTTTDGEGIIIDRPDVNSYNGQIVVENNLLIGNGSMGFEIFYGTDPPTPSNVLNLLYRYNTTTDNMQDVTHQGTDGTEVFFSSNSERLVNINIVSTNNIIEATQGSCCQLGATEYAELNSDLTNQSFIDQNWIFGIAGQNIINFGTGYRCFTGTDVPRPIFGFGSATFLSCIGNVLNTPAGFVSITIPGAPNCGGASDTQACMATTIANFTPTAPGANAYGFTQTAPTDSYNTNTYICNVMRALPSSINKHC